MAPNSASFGFGGTPSFLARVMALPALNDALNLATQVYDTTKRNEVMGAAIRAAEASMRVAATGALPLAAPILDRVGGWEAVDEWACRGLDRVEKAAPIIKKPTKEIVNRTRQTVLGAVAGDRVIVPDTLTEALIARANRMMDLVTDNVGVQAVAGVAERTLDTASRLVDTYLPPHRGDTPHTDEACAGVREKSVVLARRAGHRLYRTALRSMRPDLAYTRGAAITPSMVVTYARGTVVNVYAELLRQPRRGEKVGTLMTLARMPFRATLAVSAALGDLSLGKVVSALPGLSPATMQASLDRARDIYYDALSRLDPTTREMVERFTTVYWESLTRLRLITQAVLDTLRDVAGDPSNRFRPLIENSIQTLRVRAEEVIARLTPLVAEGGTAFRKSIDEGIHALRRSVNEGVKALRKSVNATTMREVREVVLDYARYVGEEARLWGKVVFILFQVSPNLVYRIATTVRVLTAEWLMSASAAMDGGGRKAGPLYRKGFVPVKVTMMAPREAYTEGEAVGTLRRRV